MNLPMCGSHRSTVGGQIQVHSSRHPHLWFGERAKLHPASHPITNVFSEKTQCFPRASAQKYTIIFTAGNTFYCQTGTRAVQFNLVRIQMAARSTSNFISKFPGRTIGISARQLRHRETFADVQT
jgi:hypothetical protein